MASTDLLYLDDAYLQECDATVVELTHDGVVLDRTVFYPQGGGQPADLGVLRWGLLDLPVTGVVKRDGQVIHQLDRKELSIGTKVLCRIDWPRRYAHMRAHTASHVLAAVFHDDFGAKITGNQLSETGVRIDFDLEAFDRDVVEGAVAKANSLLALNVPVSTSSLPREEALADPALVKLADALPPSIPILRIVTIGSPERIVDRQADGGTHVGRTGEVGALEILKMENKGKSNRRVYLQLLL
jgi:misacylated tRNA(Ala) deacylase